MWPATTQAGRTNFHSLNLPEIKELFTTTFSSQGTKTGLGPVEGSVTPSEGQDGKIEKRGNEKKNVYPFSSLELPCSSKCAFDNTVTATLTVTTEARAALCHCRTSAPASPSPAVSPRPR